MSKPKVPPIESVALWCATCHALVTYRCWVDEQGAAHVRPSLFAEHRAIHAEEVTPDAREVPVV
ncbi:hypothetical protein [Oerskovia paurometabola]|uniref:Uncharacterized protein n=1 Tax=Oerskovia paurometabola TaxID=162170 RepID=A0ABW1XAB1_9CELL|nr:hypothetical protein [Oerskovia paurometabola]MBM7497789.1 hypothetical protein [Oerskovia paurometabola]